ncbi:hypothetical protein [Bdellovibrio reynosensis]|uniref:Uncharacterized protein n=1 Tax=Bdellovibrio reynosensis TaxID=2835041 RepID=A0ABY4CAS9_9BACT|nr:hypothetical protein [Bdellovibrio reynosensis]UOF02037.1 hypothetical protein MNR06_03595 [Bdellovibrio reynosensis]
MKFLVYFALIFTLSLNAQAWKWPKLGGGKKSEPVRIKTVFYKTENNCSLELPETYKNETENILKNSWLWDGACPNGRAEGFGWLRYRNADGIPLPQLFLQMSNGLFMKNPTIIYLSAGLFNTSTAKEFYDPLFTDCFKTKNSSCDVFFSELNKRSSPNEITTAEGCRLTYPQRFKQIVKPSWQGACINGNADGIGILEYEETHSGTVKVNLQEVLSFSNGVSNNPFVIGKRADLLEYLLFHRYSEFQTYYPPTQEECSKMPQCNRILTAAKSLLRGGSHQDPRKTPPQENGSSNSGTSGLRGTGKYKAPTVACNDAALSAEFDRWSALEIKPIPDAVCYNAKLAAKMYEYVFNLYSNSCPNSIEEQKRQAWEGLQSAKETIAGSCVDSTY